MATAPVRVADVGGWTDTWFAAAGAVCNVAVGPGARVEVRPRPERPRTDAVRTDLPRTDAVRIVAPQVADHTLLRQAVEATGATDVDVHVTAAVPPGSALGTSAAVLVALVAALAAASGEGDDLDPDEAARRAHHLETAVAGRESGVQDHVAAAHGGTSWIEVGPFPRWRRTAVAAPPGLAERLLTVHLGGTHDSSALHRAVIARAEAGDGRVHRVLAELVAHAGEARDALAAGDLDRWGATLTAASEAQARLHPALVGVDARAVGRLVTDHGAAGWKVNGAGGAGGSVTVVGPEDPEGRAALAAAVVAGGWAVLDLAPAEGLRVVVG